MADKEIAELQGKRTIKGNTPRTVQQGRWQKTAEAHQADLERIQSGGVATKVRILVYHDSCPVCKSMEGAYEFDEVPALPQEACSHPQGCRCQYAPVLDRFGP